ncbi:MAG: DNA alkylation repair protein [Propionibacteriaceae bacterium]|nr:DNA alkylation repair protein [Propionibacteriaceae bacterium]
MGFDTFRTELRQALSAAGDPRRAEQQRRYLKSEMPMYGVGVPAVRKIAVALAEDHPALWTPGSWASSLRRLWDGAERREERFAALAIIRSRRSRELASRTGSLGLYKHLIRSGAWWDLVDETSHAVGLVLLQHPDQAVTMRAWARDDDRWIRRSAIICQLQHKARTDVGLLTDAIEANLIDGEFFIQKAIGWSLRDYARTNPDWVRAFVESHPDLSRLSLREATKHL